MSSTVGVFALQGDVREHLAAVTRLGLAAVPVRRRSELDDCDALILPGGALNADALRVEPKAQQFAKQMDADGKVMAVICHAPWLLVSSGLVEGKTLTSYPTLRDDIENAGGKWVDQEVVVDGNWVTSRKPDDLPAFNREAIALLDQSRARAGAAR